MPGRGGAGGRPGALDEARELVALVSSLSEAGDALTVEAVSSKLLVSPERARKLISLVGDLAAGGGTSLPLTEDDGGDGVVLAYSGGLRGRRLRLTRRETVALAAALERIGVEPDDPVRGRIESSLSPAVASREVVGRVGTAPRREGSPAALEACALACAYCHELSFGYRHVGEDVRAQRRAAAQQLRHEGDAWYLDALDLERGGERTFRVDRMEDVRDLGRLSELPPGGQGPSRARMVEVEFDDPRYLDLLGWHRLELISRTETGARGRIPYFGGMWLPRMIAACGGHARTSDEEVEALVRSYAREELEGRP